MADRFGRGLPEVLPLLMHMEDMPMMFDRAGNGTSRPDMISKLGDSIEEIFLILLVVVLTLWILAVSWASCSTRGADSIYEPITVSSVIEGRRKKDCRQYLNYMLLMPLHLLRSLQIPMSNSRKASSSERQLLHEKRKVFNEKVIEFLVIRRSMIFTAAVFSILTVGLSVRTFLKQLVIIEDWEKQAHLEGPTGRIPTFEEFIRDSDKPWADTKDPKVWMDYTRFIFSGMMGKLLLQTVRTDLIGAGIQIVCSLMSSILLWRALKTWSRFWLSGVLIKYCWAFVVLAPFLITMVPVRLFIDWSVMTPVTTAFIEEIDLHLGGEAHQKAGEVVEACNKLVEYVHEGKSSDISGYIEKVCGIVAHTPDAHVQCCTLMPGSIDFDFRPLHEYCRKARVYLDQEGGTQHEVALNKGARLCQDYILPAGQKHLELGLGQSIEHVAYLTPLAWKMQTALEIGFALQTAGKGLKHILPVALAMAPAMLRGAMKAKAVAPQSTIPGMFVLILPWLFCPISWAIYNTFYQLLCNVWMLIGLLLLAFFPMTFFVLGKYHNITRPLTDEKVEAMVRRMNSSSCITMIVGYIFIGTLIIWQANHLQRVGQRRTSLEDDIWLLLLEKLKFLRWYNLLELIGNSFAKFMLTTLCGVDWMLTEIGQQRRYETLLVIAEKLAELDEEESENYPRELRNTLDRQEMCNVSIQRQGRLDCVEWILYNEVPMRVEDKELEMQIRQSLSNSCCLEGRSAVGGPSRRKQLVPVLDPPPSLETESGIEMSSALRSWTVRFRTERAEKPNEEEPQPDEGEVESQASGWSARESALRMSRVRTQLSRIGREILSMKDPLEEIRAVERQSMAGGDTISAFLGRTYPDTANTHGDVVRIDEREGDTGGSREGRCFPEGGLAAGNFVEGLQPRGSPSQSFASRPPPPRSAGPRPPRAEAAQGGASWGQPPLGARQPAYDAASLGSWCAAPAGGAWDRGAPGQQFRDMPPHAGWAGAFGEGAAGQNPQLPHGTQTWR